MLAFLIALTRKEEIGTRSGRAGPSFSVRPEKEAKGAVLHGTSAAASLEAQSNLFGEPSQTQRLTAFQTHGKVRFCPCRARQGQKSPHEPRSQILRVLPRPPDSAQRRIKMPITKAIRNRTFLCTLFFS